jgi:secondary thiamine-phosphate synthase enzyme
VILNRRLRFQTSQATQFIDLTTRLREEVAAAGLRAGRIHLQSLHTTLGVAVNENEPLLLADLQAMLERLVPADGDFNHDRFERRIDISLDEPANGHAHCRLMLLHPSHTALVDEGALLLGRWQSIFAVELDGPRDREIAIQLDGEFGPAQDDDRRLVEMELARQLMVDPDPVQRPMRRLVEAGGKRLRPALVLLCSHLGPRSDRLRAAELASAVELIHNATLVHDDYVDQSSERRGRPTVAAAEGPERAIAVGDYYFAKATRLIAQLGVPAVTSTIAQAMEAICRAQIEDVALRGTYPGDYASYMSVVRGKTAALFEAACASGAQLSEAPEDVVAAISRYGELVGIAFQLADDLLDYSRRSGKPRGQDIRQRTVSLPLIFASEDREVGPEIRSLLAGVPNEAGVERVQELVVASGAAERVRREAGDLVGLAVRALEEDGVRPTLVALAESVVDREA